MMSKKKDKSFKLECGCIWTPENPARCGLCNKCLKHCTCREDGKQKIALQYVRNMIGLDDPEEE